MGFVKVSLLLFYRRIFITRWFRWSNNILIGLVTSFTLAVLLVRRCGESPRLDVCYSF